MIICKINTPTFNRDATCMYTFELIDGDRIALNHIPQDVCDLYYSTNADEILSFVIYDMGTLEDYSFVILKPSNLNERDNGVEILAIGYNCGESYRDLLLQLKFHIFRLEESNEYKYQYIWAKNVFFTEDEVVAAERNFVIERD